MTRRKISATEVSKHRLANDTWIILNGHIWDMSGFSSTHPGGPEIIESHFGKDGSEAYNSIHGPGVVLNYFGEEKRVGELDELSQPQTPSSSNKILSVSMIPKLESIVRVSQFEEVARVHMKDGPWGYIHGATEDGITNLANHSFYQKILFRPRVLNQVRDVDTSISVLGKKHSLPIFNAPTSSVKLAHPDGELAIARASIANGVPPIIPSMSSYSFQEMMAVLPPNYPFFLQLYIYRNRSESSRFLAKVLPYKPQAILLTVDLPVISKRETDRRPHSSSPDSGFQNSGMTERLMAPPPANNAIDANISWSDIAWLRNLTGLPIFLKGIQCAADAKKAYEYGCAGISISNHGGRALDTAVPAILVLLEIQATCPEILERMEVLIDGGIKRGTDVLKAMCLGASAVCVGRPLLFALSSYGEEGVKKAFEILRNELEIAMQLVGITTLDQAHPGLLNTAALDPFVYTRDGHPFARKIDRSRL